MYSQAVSQKLCRQKKLIRNQKKFMLSLFDQLQNKLDSLSYILATTKLTKMYISLPKFNN